jgi:lipopolysaccharide/colanic/teichoic acid biosynthesis glycosyltransferase
VAALVAIDVGLPVAFWQQRPGLGGRPFRLYKLRTMAAPHDALGRRVPDGERISGVGRLLRRMRLDELPQLLSILMGDMSFVGPRPLLPVDQPAEYSARLLVRPGLTGWAQVRGGREISAADKAALDVWYVQKASLVLDIKIVLATVPMLFFGERANPAAIRRAWRDLCEAGICVSADTEGERNLEFGLDVKDAKQAA